MMPGSSRSGPLRPQSERHFFIVSGLPDYYDWQKLKDVVRDATTNQPGWTSMDESWRGPEGAKGYFSVKSQQDADSVYDLLVSDIYARPGRALLVHHFDASRLDPVLIRCNCRMHHPGCLGQPDNGSHITARSVLAAQNIRDRQPISPIPFGTTAPMHHPGLTVPIAGPQMPMYAPPVAFYQAAAPMSPVVTNEHGFPVNSVNGVARPYRQPLAVELRSGHATVRLGSTEEARRAIGHVGKKTWEDRQIFVKDDRDAMSVSGGVVVRSSSRTSQANR
ncbi:hypothetical protein MPH_12986 [Macrophomina phaseolina MS6]|uniref:Uncharacterized protein n=1 Tax=Macrophomina phaseolina (strain MS6) TaxID=1126212 RepID=K2RIL2_MACPH|nr:hypothetical protein MPH_12986 [Macrophomina phaseolina MS6]